MTGLPAGMASRGTPNGAAADAQTPLWQFLALAIRDEALARALGAEGDGDRFADLAIEAAGARGIALDAAGIRAAAQPDPLGITRWTITPHIGLAWPGKDWLPINVIEDGRRLYVDWAYFSDAPLTEPFFEDSIRRALRRPLNRMCRYRMSLDDMLHHADSAESLTPAGFIFHMSRCGSTLVAQMLAALPDTIVVSEAAPIDAIVRIICMLTALPAERQIATLRAIVAAFGRKRSGNESHYFLKLDSWHALALPLFVRAFPATPWVFLCRDPVEVLVSQMRERGLQMVPQLMPPRLYGIDDTDTAPDASYCARVLGKICAAAADELASGGGIAVDYRDLPEAVFTRILPHLGLSCDADARAIMRHAARYDAKSRYAEFTGDSKAKQHAASVQLRALAERHVGNAYRRLSVV